MKCRVIVNAQNLKTLWPQINFQDKVGIEMFVFSQVGWNMSQSLVLLLLLLLLSCFF